MDGSRPVKPGATAIGALVVARGVASRTPSGCNDPAAWRGPRDALAERGGSTRACPERVAEIDVRLTTRRQILRSNVSRGDTGGPCPAGETACGRCTPRARAGGRVPREIGPGPLRTRRHSPAGGSPDSGRSPLAEVTNRSHRRRASSCTSAGDRSRVADRRRGLWFVTTVTRPRAAWYGAGLHTSPVIYRLGLREVATAWSDALGEQRVASGYQTSARSVRGAGRFCGS